MGQVIPEGHSAAKRPNNAGWTNDNLSRVILQPKSVSGLSDSCIEIYTSKRNCRHSKSLNFRGRRMLDRHLHTRQVSQVRSMWFPIFLGLIVYLSPSSWYLRTWSSESCLWQFDIKLTAQNLESCMNDLLSSRSLLYATRIHPWMDKQFRICMWVCVSVHRPSNSSVEWA